MSVADEQGGGEGDSEAGCQSRMNKEVEKVAQRLDVSRG